MTFGLERLATIDDFLETSLPMTRFLTGFLAVFGFDALAFLEDFLFAFRIFTVVLVPATVPILAGAGLSGGLGSLAGAGRSERSRGFCMARTLR